jgi:site-specific recombinase XerD
MNKNTAAELLAQTLLRIDGAYSPATLRAYRADCNEFIEYAASIGATALPASGITLSGFINHLMQRGQKSASIRRSVAGIGSIHTLSGYADPSKEVEVKLTIRRMHRQIGRYHHQALGISKEILTQMLTAVKDDLRGSRDRALLMVAYDTLCRRSELLSLQIKDISTQIFDQTTGIPNTAILLRKSKTDQYAEGRWLRLSPPTAAALQRWISKSKLSDGLIFRGVNRANKITSKLDSSQLARIYKKTARLAGFDESIVSEISGHSTRVGAAQDLLLSGASLPMIMNRGRWSKSETVMRYVEKVGMPV